MQNQAHIAWRFLGGQPAYVEHVGNGQQHGDKYSYTYEESKALRLTEAQCRAFCNYMRACATVGYWS